jgi:hypothetical protein
MGMGIDKTGKQHLVFTIDYTVKFPFRSFSRPQLFNKSIFNQKVAFFYQRIAPADRNNADIV